MKFYRVKLGGQVVTFSDATPVVVMKQPGKELELGAPAMVSIGPVGFKVSMTLAEAERALLEAEEVKPAPAIRAVPS